MIFKKGQPKKNLLWFLLIFCGIYTTFYHVYHNLNLLFLFLFQEIAWTDFMTLKANFLLFYKCMNAFTKCFEVFWNLTTWRTNACWHFISLKKSYFELGTNGPNWPHEIDHVCVWDTGRKTNLMNSKISNYRRYDVL